MLLPLAAPAVSDSPSAACNGDAAPSLEGASAPPAVAGAEGGDGGEASAEEVFERFKTFDVKRASCFREEERQHLLSVIEGGFGDLEAFNSIVRHLFTHRLEGKEMSSSTRRASTRRDPRALANGALPRDGASTAGKAAAVPRLGGLADVEAVAQAV